jgi:hypothetical protein
MLKGDTHDIQPENMYRAGVAGCAEDALHWTPLAPVERTPFQGYQQALNIFVFVPFRN